MMKSLFIILAISLCISTNVTFGEDICSHYDDIDCIHPDITKLGHFINQWSVYLPGMTKEEAKEFLENHGFVYLGQVLDGVDLHLVTKKDTFEKHVMPNERIIELLKTHEKVHSVAQIHVINNSPDLIYDIIDTDKVECQKLDPNTIELNDGSENLIRIQIGDTTETDSTSKYSRPVSNNHESVDTNEINDANTNNKNSN